jgi:hypothetical protein
MARNAVASLQCLMALLVLAGCGVEVSDEDIEVQSLEQDISVDGSCSAERQAELARVHYFASYYTQRALDAFNANPDSATSKRWFGNQDGAGKNIIGWVFQRTLSQFARNDTKFYCTCVEQSTYAKSTRLHPEQGVKLCEYLYWSAPEIGVNSQVGVMAHEFTHTSAGTDDVTNVFQASGPPTAMALANDSPSETTHNAISYQYFIEDIASQ